MTGPTPRQGGRARGEERRNAAAPLRLAHLYPDHMNLYGDRGNMLCLEARCRWRGIPLAITSVDIGDDFQHDAWDMIFIGGGPDREQQRIARDLAGLKATALRQAVEAGVVLLAVCGGYQLLGHYYRPAEGDDLPGVGIFDVHTEHPGPAAKRCIGNLVAEWLRASSGGGSGRSQQRRDAPHGRTLVGFENHGGRTYLGPGCQPLASVLAGFGNNGEDRTEGAVSMNAFGTYLHGSFLPKNPAFADHLISLALSRRGDGMALSSLDDTLELRAHRAAAALALRRR